MTCGSRGGESVVRVSMEPRSSVRASVAHGAADIALLSSKRPDETTRIEDAVKRGAANSGPDDASSVSTRLWEANPSRLSSPTLGTDSSPTSSASRRPYTVRSSLRCSSRSSSGWWRSW